MSDQQLPPTSPADSSNPRTPTLTHLIEAASTYVRDTARDVLDHTQPARARDPRQRFALGLLGGICVVFLAALLSTPTYRDTPLQVAVFMFVVAIALLSPVVWVTAFEVTPHLNAHGEAPLADGLASYVRVAGIGGSLAVVLGISAVVWHLNPWAVLVGWLSAVLAGIIASAVVAVGYEKKRQQRAAAGHTP